LILNFGSINIDNVYRVANLVTAGQTITAQSFERVLGGKGINQSIAIERAGGKVYHVGNIGSDDWISEQLKLLGVDMRYVQNTNEPTGHAIISVDDDGENEIVIFAGANDRFDLENCESILEDHAPEAPWVVLQNEINLTTEVARAAKALGYKICYSAAPFDAEKALEVLPYVDLLALNEKEYAELREVVVDNIEDLNVGIVLVTLGARGAQLIVNEHQFTQESFDVAPIDTTGAGDTFLGSFLARLDMGNTAADSMKYAAAAAAIQVTRMGAAPAIPNQSEVITFLETDS
jgi:ribokinase